MATVYLGYQSTVDRHVAIKVLPPHPALDTQFVSRFQTEARTIARLQHPHILPLYDYGQQDDILYLVMAYAEGGSLEDRINEGPMSLKRIERYLREIAGAMDYAHRQGIYHRDIKPANILLSSEDHALLADFGIAKLAEGDANLTGTGVVGTPMYMAPEQAEGLPMDPRADVYSLGVVVYQMLTGKIPFHADSVMQIMLKVMQEPAPSILEARPDLPPELAKVMDKVLTKEPDDRYQSAMEFADAFSAVIAKASSSKLNTPSQPVQKAQKTEGPVPTRIFEDETDLLDAPQAQTPPQTVIVQQAGNQFILIGGFLVIAVTMILLVFFLVNNENTNTAGNQTSPTQVVSQPTDADTIEATAEPTAIPTAVAIAVPTFGRLSFNSVNAPGDAITLRVDDLDQPDTGNAYYAYLLNTVDESSVALGRVVTDPLGSGVLSYADEEERMLPAIYNAVIITEAGEGVDLEDSTIPGEVAYHGSIPIELTEALHQLFIASEEGVNGAGYLETMIIEARNAANHAGLAARASSIGGMSSHAEHTINILLGEEEDLNGNGRGENPGRGVGVVPVIDWANAQLANAVNVEGATPNIQENAGLIEVCLVNTLKRSNRLIELEAEMLAAESLEAIQTQMEEATTIAGALIEGFDFNENGEIEAFEEECGLAQIEIYGVLAGSMDIVEGGLAE